MIRILLTLGFSLILLGCCGAENRADVPGEKRIALTYDDAPLGDGWRFTGAERTDALLAQFETAKTGPVAIFSTTDGLSEDGGQDRMQAYAMAGHRIANHSHTHLWASQTPVETYIADIDKAEVALSAFANRRPWYRFPYLDEGGYGEDAAAALVKRDALRTALASRSLISGYVTVDTYDWHMDHWVRDATRGGRTIDDAALSRVYAAMVVEAANHYDQMSIDLLGRRPAQVLLLHENDLAASYTSDMVAALRADGWTIIDPDDAFLDPIVDKLPKTRFAGKGRIAALVTDEGDVDADYLDHWSSSEAGIEARLNTAGVFSD